MELVGGLKMMVAVVSSYLSDVVKGEAVQTWRRASRQGLLWDEMEFNRWLH